MGIGRGKMTAMEFYRKHVDGEITVKNDIQYYRGSIIVVSPDDDKKQKLIDLGILIVPKQRNCLQCSKPFPSTRNMRVCKACKSARGDWSDDGNIYYESSSGF